MIENDVQMVEIVVADKVCVNKLHDELVAAVPASFVVDGLSVGYVYELADGVGVRLLVPEGADEAAIRAVIAAHDPTPLAPVAAPDAPAALEDRLIAALEALPPDRVVSASELLAILRPEATPDA